MTGPLLGVIADDLTGACDVAEAITRAGLSTIVLLGVPTDDETADADCVVVALKSRTTPPHEAVAESTASAAWLLRHGAGIIYQKYCSTFDSTDEGNIGPVSDALSGVVREANRRAGGDSLLTVGTPATPAVGRTQYLGHLFVDRQLLAESPLRDHPLTPMRDSNLVRVLGRQTENRVGLVDLVAVRDGSAAVRAELAAHRTAGTGHVLVDSVTDADLDALADAVMPAGGGSDGVHVFAGAAGFAGALARRLVANRERRGAVAAGHRADQFDGLPPVPRGRRLIVSGSASARSREQAAAFAGPTVTFDPVRVAKGDTRCEDLTALVEQAFAEVGTGAVLVAPEGTSDADGATRVRAVQSALGTEASAHVVESTLAAVACHAIAGLGANHLIVAGGETSGAVAGALGIRSLGIGASAARGVPWMIAHTSDGKQVALLLKSGNFGDADLFATAWEVAP